MTDNESANMSITHSIESFEALLRTAQREITIIGINPLIPLLENSGRFLGHLLKLRQTLSLNIVYENDNDNFHLATTIGAAQQGNRKSFDYLTSHKLRVSGEASASGLQKEITSIADDPEVQKSIRERTKILQSSLRMPINILKVDDQIFHTYSIDGLATLENYTECNANSEDYKRLSSAVLTYTSLERQGRLFLSRPGDELIWVYDSENYPRGVFPRQSFYTTDYGRYVVWVFVFNRKGKLLLQRRSESTSDNRGLWDKSVGGHVDLNDTSTTVTAKRELVEEMYLPEAEFTEYISADVGDIVDFGEWKPNKRPERCFVENFNSLGVSDWVMFRATDQRGLPLTDRRTSLRRLHRDGKVITKKTIFHSDCFLMVAPEGQLDSDEQVVQSLRFATEKGAASGHKLVEIPELRDWVLKEEQNGTEAETFTDDLIHIQATYSGMLERFSEFVKFIEREMQK